MNKFEDVRNRRELSAELRALEEAVRNGAYTPEFLVGITEELSPALQHAKRLRESLAAHRSRRAA